VLFGTDVVVAAAAAVVLFVSEADEVSAGLAEAGLGADFDGLVGAVFVAFAAAAGLDTFVEDADFTGLAGDTGFVLLGPDDDFITLPVDADLVGTAGELAEATCFGPVVFVADAAGGFVLEAGALCEAGDEVDAGPLAAGALLATLLAGALVELALIELVLRSAGFALCEAGAFETLVLGAALV